MSPTGNAVGNNSTIRVSMERAREIAGCGDMLFTWNDIGRCELCRKSYTKFDRRCFCCGDCYRHMMMGQKKNEEVE